MNWFVKCVQHISCRRSFHFIFWICKNSIRTSASIQFTRAFACAYIESNVTPSFVCASQESWFPLFTSHTFLPWGHPNHCRNRWVLTLMPEDYSGDGNSNTDLMHWKSEKLQFFSKQIGTGSCVCVWEIERKICVEIDRCSPSRSYTCSSNGCVTVVVASVRRWGAEDYKISEMRQHRIRNSVIETLTCLCLVKRNIILSISLVKMRDATSQTIRSRVCIFHFMFMLSV